MRVATSSRWTDRLAAILLAPMHWLERARGRKRLALLAVYAVIVSVAAFSLWWLQSLRSLPDIDDPFDMETLRAKSVAKADNAFPLYLQASERLSKMSSAHRGKLHQSATAIWSATSPEAREALELHREALLLWREATDRPGMQVVNSGETSPQSAYDVVHQAEITFPLLAMLEGSRLEDQGDMAGAWEWYRAILKAHMHISDLDLRGWWRGYFPTVPHRFARWAADPRVDATLLRQALAEARAIDAAIPSFVSSLRGTYRWAISQLEARLATNQAFIREDEWYKATPMYWPGLKFLRREPERSRRILRLLYANLAAHVDNPPSRRPRVVPPGMFDVGIDPSGHDDSRRITPQELARQIDASLLPKHVTTGSDVLFDISREQAARATILIELASQLYKREHGSPPKVYEDLVGPYLDKLPAGAIDPNAP